MKNQRLLVSFLLASIVALAAGESCQERRTNTGTLWSQDGTMTADLTTAGYVATFNNAPLDQLDNTQLFVGSPYVFEISHSDDSMQGLVEFELDWSSMVHSKCVGRREKSMICYAMV